MAWKVFDLYCGLGGLGLGFQKAGFEITGGIDHWQPAVDANARLLGHEAHNEKVENADQIILDSGWTADEGILTGGPPCQGFSYANQRRDPSHYEESKKLRSEVVNYMELIKRLQPAGFIIENVGGIRTQRKSIQQKDAAKVLEDLMDEVYHVDVKMLDSADFDVAQHRRRVFFSGIKRELIQDEADPVTLFPSPTHHDFSKTVRNVNEREGLKEDKPENKKTPLEWKKEYLERGDPNPDLMRLKPARSVKQAIDHLCVLKAGQSSSKYPNHSAGTIQERVKRCLELIPAGGNIGDVYSRDPSRLNASVVEKLKASNGRVGSTVWYLYKRMNWMTGPGPAIPCEIRAGNGYAHPTQDRAITVREAACLQEFKDVIFEEKLPKKDCYRLIGNAVPPPVAEAMANAMLETLGSL